MANPVRFYTMGIEANNDDTPMDDYVYKATRLIVVEPKKRANSCNKKEGVKGEVENVSLWIPAFVGCISGIQRLPA